MTSRMVVFGLGIGIGWGLFLAWQIGRVLAWTWASLWPLRCPDRRAILADVYGILRKYRSPMSSAFYAFRDARYF